MSTTALIVDDDRDVRGLTARALTREGFRCHMAEDGAAALSLMQNQDYDIVVTDILMPKLHGHALAVQLLDRDARSLVVVLTSMLERKLVLDLLARGIDDICFKPVDYGMFAARLKVLYQRHRCQWQGVESPTSKPTPLSAQAVTSTQRNRSSTPDPQDLVHCCRSFQAFSDRSVTDRLLASPEHQAISSA